MQTKYLFKQNVFNVTSCVITVSYGKLVNSDTMERIGLELSRYLAQRLLIVSVPGISKLAGPVGDYPVSGYLVQIYNIQSGLNSGPGHLANGYPEKSHFL